MTTDHAPVTMRAFGFARYGGPEAASLRTVPRPRPGRGEVLVRVRAAGLNPVDFKTRQGALRTIQRYRLPVVMGNELAGVVEACGEGATRFAPGDRVFARVPKAAMGAFAESAVVPEALLAAMPASLGFEAAELAFDLAQVVLEMVTFGLERAEVDCHFRSSEIAS